MGSTKPRARAGGLPEMQIAILEHSTEKKIKSCDGRPTKQIVILGRLANELGGRRLNAEGLISR